MILFKGIDNLLFNYSVINLLIVVSNNYISLLNFVINSISVFLIFVINSICQVTEYSLFDGYI